MTAFPETHARVLNPKCGLCDAELAAPYTPTGFLPPGQGTPSRMIVGECEVYGWLPAHECNRVAA